MHQQDVVRVGFEAHLVRDARRHRHGRDAGRADAGVGGDLEPESPGLLPEPLEELAERLEVRKLVDRAKGKLIDEHPTQKVVRHPIDDSDLARIQNKIEV